MAMFQGFVLQVILIAFISGSLADQHLLPAPENISMVSINLKHFLHWDPVMGDGNVTYSVQSQGEYESVYMPNDWHEPENCQEIFAQHCNVTDEVSATVLYKFRVRSVLGNQLSAWKELEPPFNRKTTLLIPPKIVLKINELNLVVHIEDYGINFHFYVFYWQKGNKNEMTCKRISGYNAYAFLEKAEEGKEYCAEAIAHASPISKNSSSSDVVCVQVEERSRLFTGILCLFVVLVALVPLILAVWKSATIVRYFCCPDQDIPDALKEPDIDRRMLKNYYSLMDKSKEIEGVELHEDRLLPRK